MASFRFMSDGRVRYKCNRCGNSAMFVFSGEAKIEKLQIWLGRRDGYGDLSAQAKTRVLAEQLKSKPTTCWVCGSEDIGRANRLPQEIEELQ